MSYIAPDPPVPWRRYDPKNASARPLAEPVERSVPGPTWKLDRSVKYRSPVMDFTDTPAEAAFRAEVRGWLAEHLTGEFAALGPGGGPADETGWDVRIEWEKLLGADRWVGMSWPTEYGGRGLDTAQQIIFNEEYARAGAPARISFFGEGLFAPTLIAFGTPEQKQRFLPRIQRVEELWCQGFSEPNAGSDLANIQTRAVLDGDEWVITGQKVWTTLAHRADWCFVVCRTDPESKSHHGLSYLLCPMDQPGIEVRPLRQLTGSSEFNEVFFDGARTAKENVLGPVGEGWKVAMATLGFERGTAFLSAQLGFEAEFDECARVRAQERRGGGTVAARRARAALHRAATDEVQRHAFAHHAVEDGHDRPGSEPRQAVLDELAQGVR